MESHPTRLVETIDAQEMAAGKPDADEGTQIDDSHQSSKATTPESTSTVIYSYEPYETFQDRVLDLIRDIGGRDVELLPRMQGGGHNRVVPLKHQLDTASGSQATVEGLLRVPRMLDIGNGKDDNGEPWIWEQILDQVALWRFVKAHGFPVPRVLAFDASAMNAIGSPHTVYELVDGERLDELWDDMFLTEKREIIDQFVDLLIKMEDVAVPRC